jgi:hypothetical protein
VKWDPLPVDACEAPPLRRSARPSALSGGDGSGRFWSSFGWEPLVLRHIDAQSAESCPFGFKQASLKRCARLLQQNSPAGAHYAMPRYAAAGRARTHRPACAASAAAKPHRFRQLAVCNHTASRHTLHKVVHRLPSHIRSGRRNETVGTSPHSPRPLALLLHCANRMFAEN